MLSRAIYKKQRGRRWLTALATLSLVTGTFVIATATQALSSDIKLDRNATHTLSSTHLGGLKSSISSTTATTFVVCELVIAPTTLPFTIQIDAERMSVTGVSTTAANTGGCAFSNPADVPIDARTWTVTRGVDGTTAATHSGSPPRNDVTRIETGSGHDWDQVYQDVVVNQTGCSDIGAVACTFKTRPNTGTASSANGFTGPTTFTGTSGDTQPISAWVWTNQSVPDADEINDAYAAKYSTAHQNLFVGMDRYAVNGSKDIGFWFFHQAVSPVDGGGFSGAHCAPNQATNGCPGAPHGDLLLLTTFSAGGGTTTVRAYEWVGSGGSDGSLNFLGSFGDCSAGVGSTTQGCATTANTTVPAPWTHQEKPTGASPNIFYASGFMEGGIDLTLLGEEGCFASFLGTSRSSPSLTAQPKAFVGGGFEACTSGLVTTPSAGKGGTAAIGSSGTLSVSDSALLTVGGSSTWSGTLKFFLCGPIASGTCDGTTNVGTQVGTTQNVSNADTQPFNSASTSISAAGFYCWRGEFHSGTSSIPDATDSSADECFTVTPLTPGINTQVKKVSDDSNVTSIQVGTAVYDTAALTGSTTNAGGTVRYRVYTDNTCSTLLADTPGTAFNAQTDKAVTNHVAAKSDNITLAVGSYWFQATYQTGDANNVAGAVSACTSEAVLVQAVPTITTQVKNAADDSNVTTSIPAGTIVYDTAALSNATADAGGTVRYRVYTDNTCSTLLADTPGTAFNAQTDKTVTNGVAAKSDNITLAAGHYWFQATYQTGDAHNVAGAKSVCTSEAVVVQATPAPHSTPIVQIKDSVTVTGFSTSPAPTGNIVVGLYSASDCAAASQIGSDAPFAVTASQPFLTSFVGAPQADYYYKVSYAGDANNVGFSSCTEHVGVTITTLP